MSKRFVILGIAVLVLCGGLVGWQVFRNMMMASYFAKGGRPPVTVETLSVNTSTWKPGIQAVGTTRAQSGADLSVQAAGVVRTIGFAAGDKVKAGQLLIQLDDSTERADMASAQANITMNQRALERQTELRKSGYVAQAAWDQAKAQLDVSRAAYARAAASADLKAIKAPFDGVVGIPQVNIGQYVQPGVPLVTLQNLDELKIDFTVPEDVAAKLQPGQPVTFGINETDLHYSGRLNGIDPKVDVTTHLVSAQALLDNQNHQVLPGQFLYVRVELANEPNVVTVPQTAVVNSLYGDFVYLVVDETHNGKTSKVAKQTFVQTGRRELGTIEIKGGIKPGDIIVSVGQNKLQNGAPVTLAPPAQASNSGGAG
jgi:membrane fusion protein (multidrug efflux system)